MNGVFDFKNGNFRCDNETARLTGKNVVCYKGNLFLDKAAEQRALSDIGRNHPNYDAFRSLRGQFAIALMSAGNKTLSLVRDQCGVMPLYYTVEKNKLFFGTHVRDVMKDLDRQRAVNEQVVHEYFMYRYVSGENTLFKDIFEVKPGCLIEIDEAGVVRQKRYYDFQYSGDMKGEEARASALFEEAFLKSLESQTGDSRQKEIGVLSSGGIDSSLLVSCAQRRLSPHYKTYYAGFESYKHNRIDEVNDLSKKYGTNHKNIIITNQDFSKNLVKAISTNEEPLNHPSTVVRAFLCEQIKGDADVLLSGEGADCFYCGYYVYDMVKCSYVNNPARFLSKALATLLPVNIAPRKYRSKLTRIKNVFTLEPDEYVIFNDILSQNSRHDIGLLLNRDFPASFAENYISLFKNHSKKDILNRILYLYQTDYIVEALKTITKIGNSFGIEHRHPFIDVDLINLFNSLPWREKARQFKRKIQVANLGRKYLPAEFLRKSKEGFGVPIHSWFYEENGLGGYMNVLTDKKTRERGTFKTPYLDNIVNNYHRKKLSADAFESVVWPIINYELWCRIFIDNDLKGYE